MHYRVKCVYCENEHQYHESLVEVKLDTCFGEYLTVECVSCGKNFNESLYVIEE